ncbi:MAG: DUF1830 domain-containing protein [Microcoleaceae cyanobacterium]
MAQILDPLPSDAAGKILCCYVNATSQIQIARVTNLPNWYFERVVFPGQRLVFEALPIALLEIHTGMMASSILSDKIPCDRLRIDLDDLEVLQTEVIGEVDHTQNISDNISPRPPLAKPKPALSSIDNI